MIRIGFTGTQNGLTDEQETVLRGVLEAYEHEAVEFHHGDCIGADARAHELADDLSFDVVIHPPDVDAKRAFCHSPDTREPKPYLVRNHDIVDETTTLVACPNGTERVRSGTWATVRYARQRILDGAQQLTIIISPTGQITREGRRT